MTRQIHFHSLERIQARNFGVEGFHPYINFLTEKNPELENFADCGCLIFLSTTSTRK